MVTESKNNEIKTIFVVAGHGKSWIGTKDPGAVCGDFVERDLNVEVGKHLIEKIKKQFPKMDVRGVGVETDANISAKKKFMKECVKQGALRHDETIAIHIHCNSFSDKKARGVECYSDYSKLTKFGNKITQLISSWFVTKDRGCKSASGTRAGFINYDPCESILIECGFITNEYDQKYLKRTEDIAETIVFALKEFI